MKKSILITLIGLLCLFAMCKPLDLEKEGEKATFDRRIEELGAQNAFLPSEITNDRSATYLGDIMNANNYTRVGGELYYPDGTFWIDFSFELDAYIFLYRYEIDSVTGTVHHVHNRASGAYLYTDLADINNFALVYTTPNGYQVHNLVENTFEPEDPSYPALMPCYSNFVQGNTCNVGWDAFVKEWDGTSWGPATQDFDDCEWYINGELVSTENTFYAAKYDNGELDSSCSGIFQPDVNGYHAEVKLVINKGRRQYERISDGWLLVNEVPEGIPTVQLPIGAPENTFSNYEGDPLDFCVNCD